MSAHSPHPADSLKPEWLRTTPCYFPGRAARTAPGRVPDRLRWHFLQCAPYPIPTAAHDDCRPMSIGGVHTGEFVARTSSLLASSTITERLGSEKSRIPR